MAMLELYHRKDAVWCLDSTYPEQNLEAATENAKRVAQIPGIEGVVLILEAGIAPDGSAIEKVIYRDTPGQEKFSPKDLQRAGGLSAEILPEDSIGHAAQKERAATEKDFLAEQRTAHVQYLAEKARKRKTWLAQQKAEKDKKRLAARVNFSMPQIARKVLWHLSTNIFMLAVTLVVYVAIRKAQFTGQLSSDFSAAGITVGCYLVALAIYVWKSIPARRPRSKKSQTKQPPLPVRPTPIFTTVPVSPPFEEMENFQTEEEEEEVLDDLACTGRATHDEAAFQGRMERMVLRVRRCLNDGLFSESDLGDLLFYMAGVGEAFALSGGVPNELLKSELEKAARLLGMDDRATAQVARLDDHLVDDRIFDLYRRARYVGVQLVRDPDSHDGLPDLIRSWQATGTQIVPEDGESLSDLIDPDEVPPEPVSEIDIDPEFDPMEVNGYGTELEGTHQFAVIMFTDIVNSTALQELHGDEWNIDVVRAHNKIARMALKSTSGREIKHTGDGMMAKYASIPNALNGALAMQRGFDLFSQAKPDRAFGVRIGLHAGEPLHESGDLYGAVVNLTARITDKAGAGEISVTSTVRELARGKGYAFDDLGTFELKGVGSPQTLYFLKSA